MTGHKARIRWTSVLASGWLAAASLLSAGCQVDVAGQSLPSAYYLSDDVQHLSAGPEFKLSAEAAAMKAYQNQATGQEP